MALFKAVDGVKIQLTVEEEKEINDETKRWNDAKPIRDALATIQKLESLETPRRLAESVLSDAGKTWLTSNREKITTERAKLKG